MSGYNSKFTGAEVDARLDLAATAYQKPTAGIPATDLESTTQEQLNSIANKVDKVEGKGLSTNDLTDEMVEKIAAAATEEDYYPKMRVGYSDNLTGRGEAEEAVFTYRPTDGATSVESGVATIKRIKGNSVVFNQLVQNGNFATTSNWSPYASANVSYTIENNTLTVTSNYAGSGADQTSIRQTTTNSFIAGHKYLIHFEYTTTNSSLTPLLEYYGTLQSDGNVIDSLNSSNHYYTISTATTTRESRLYLKALGTKAVGDTWTFKDVMVIDLTQMFGTGNEPTTVEEFRALYPDVYYEYNEGTLQDLSCSGIETVGFNLIDKNNFADGVIHNSETPVTTANYSHIKIAVFPNTKYYLKDVSNYYYWNSYIFYDRDMNRIRASGKVVTGDNPYNVSFVVTTPSNAAYMIVNVHKDFVDTCCVNLHHTGYRDGEYEPYKEVTHSLPLSQITNGQPLRKAGSVFDEINNESYIQRVGQRAFAEGDAEDTTLFTDGTTTNYPLAESIVTPIPAPFNLAYEVDDFGTEEALLAEDSAPFSADIVYQFNAVDRIRANSKEIDNVGAEIEQLNTDIASIHSKINFALIPTAGFTPNIDTAKKVLDLGNDPVLCIGNKIYGVSQFPSSFNPRSILIYDADENSGATRLLFNKSTCILYAKTVYYTMTDDEILIGVFRLGWSTHNFISAELPFEYTIDGRSLYNTPPTIYSTHSIIHKVSATNKGVLSAGSYIQGCDIYNGLLFQGQDGGVINIFDTENNYTHIGGYQSVLSLHFTNLSFGTEKAEETDEFPLLYIPENGSTGYELYVLRVTRDTSELMQTLAFPSDGNIGYYPVSVIDKENGFIYCWCYKKNSYTNASDNAFIITKYALPALSAGDITLTLVDKFVVPYRGVGQGATCDGINLYFQCGLGSSPSYLQIINLQNKCEIGLWDITEHSSSEPEGIAIKDGGLVMTHIDNSITFVEFK